MKNLILIVALMISGGIGAQVSLLAGQTTTFAFGNKKPYAGFHLGVEIPRDDAVSFYLKYTHHFNQTQRSPGQIFVQDTIPPYMDPNFFQIGYDVKMNYNTIEGGTRYYLGNGFDYGFAAYGGTMLKAGFNQVKIVYDDFDEDNYQNLDINRNGSIFSVSAGLAGGVKYSFDRLGTLYFDVSIDYAILTQGSYGGIGSEVLTGYGTGQWNALNFNLSLGYRKDILW